VFPLLYQIGSFFSVEIAIMRNVTILDSARRSTHKKQQAGNIKTEKSFPLKFHFFLIETI